MSSWSKNELRKITESDDLHISPFREDGATYGTPTWIWSVVVDGNLYVRAYNGTNSSWYQAATKQKAGRVAAGGLTKEVAFEAVGGQIDDSIDDAYRAKYVKPIFEAHDRHPSSLCNGPDRSQRLVSASQYFVIRRLPCAISPTIPIKSMFLLY
jgi:hypothetical protein